MRAILWTILLFEAGFLIWYIMMTGLFIADIKSDRENGVGMGLLIFFASALVDKVYWVVVLGHVLYTNALQGKFLAWAVSGYIIIGLLRAFGVTYLTYYLFNGRIKSWLYR